jgi:hypothetical protein
LGLDKNRIILRHKPEIRERLAEVGLDFDLEKMHCDNFISGNGIFEIRRRPYNYESKALTINDLIEIRIELFENLKFSQSKRGLAKFRLVPQ